jgi:hypothetical protein
MLLVFIQTVLFSSYFTVNIQYVRHLGSIFKKLSFGSHDLCDVKSRENQNNKYILLGAYCDFVLLVRNLALFDYSDGKYPRYQVDKVLPYQFESKPGLQTSNSGDESDSEEQSETSDEEIAMCLRSKMLAH